jgi:hypothetical protein
VTPSRSRSRSPDQDKVEHADILGHYNQLAHAGVESVLHARTLYDLLLASILQVSHPFVYAVL